MDGRCSGRGQGRVTGDFPASHWLPVAPADLILSSHWLRPAATRPSSGGGWREERAGTADVAAVFLDFGKIFVFEQKIFPNIEPPPATLGGRRREMASRNISGRIN